MQDGGLLVHLVTALVAALIGAAVALRLGQPLILGYVLAGVAIGPFTPGIIGQTEAIAELAELGIIFLMFVIGAQLSMRALVRAGRVAILGALLQVAVMIGLGYLVGRALGWGPLESYAFGAVISNSSSTVLGKVLSDRGELDSRHAQLGIAWSSVQDISTVALVAVLAFLSPSSTAVGPLLGKAALFFFVVVPLSFWVVPWGLRRASALHNREFFALAVVTLALAMAGGASLLGVSLALGAFLTGVVVGESDLAHRILGDAIPMRDIFSGIFFVSIGMLLDPAFVLDAWALVLVTVALIVLAKGAVTTVLARWLGCSTRLSVLIGAALAQSAEFSFLLARIGLEQGALSRPIFNLLLSATVVTILLSPLVNGLAPALLRRVQARRVGAARDADAARPSAIEDHAIVCGYGRVGSIVCALLEQHRKPFVVIEEDLRVVESLRARGVSALFGDAGLPDVLDRASLRTAHLLILCIPERMAARRALEHAREVSRAATVLARTHSYEDRAFLHARGADEAVVGEMELALELGRRALQRFGVEPDVIERSLATARRAHA
ncbi:sodium/hydrogen exchanger [Sorangium cellulosum]|uniref:Sodium/hydrogen exchanger n=1 Tax=Sorangium cellulosum TaxID=56 RepID=A0A4P2Q573_SORCE|nr:cation:proton antiporter [Sorangium cellulosum]AUX24545.1 sodium/hydrogen exchanger [Sorangium cellulosum]